MNAQIIQLENILVPHPHFTAAMGRLTQCFKHATGSRDPIGIALIGDSGAGKSRVLEEFEAEHPSYRTDTGLIVPVLRLRLPSRPTVKHLIELLLHKLEDPLFDKGTENIKLLRLLKLLRHTQTLMLLLDEFQHFVDKSTHKVLHHLADTLKVIVDESRLALVVAGLPGCKAVLDQNVQLARRFLAPVVMPRFDWAQKKSRAEFVGILISIQEALAPYKLPQLGNADMAFRFYCATGGLFGYIVKILRQALWNATDNNTIHITLADLQSAYHSAVWPTVKGAGFEVPFASDFMLTPNDATLIIAQLVGTADEPES